MTKTQFSQTFCLIFWISFEYFLSKNLVFMLINKKYHHKIWKIHHKTFDIDGYYPLILPTLDPLSLKSRESLASWKFYTQSLLHNQQKNFSPLVLFSQETQNYQSCLQKKTNLPFFAKKQRISHTQIRNLKKSDQSLKVFLGEHQTFSFSSLNSSKIQEICDLLVRKKYGNILHN